MTARHTSRLQALLVSDDFEGDVYPHEPLARHTTYRIGGPARFFVRVDTLSALEQLIAACVAQGVPWTVLGRGSNVLVADRGYDGVVINLGRDFRRHRLVEESNTIVAGAGCSLSVVVQEAFRRSLAGMEFAVGTPGSLGGALRMNAGTATDWIGQRVASVTVLEPDGTLVRRRGDEVEWGYRHTSFAADEVILECELSVKPADPFFIRGKMEALVRRRKGSQPLGARCCGSVFKNPEGKSAAQLIEACGLKGAVAGDAQISPVHANFIVNRGKATARDVSDLMVLIQTKVRETYGIELQPEVRFLGFS